MLEQPPERSHLAVEAEAAALAQASMPYRPNGCVRLIVWCTPTPLFFVIIFAIAALVNAVGFPANGYIVFSLMAFLIIGINFGLGCFDALFCESVMVVSPEHRRKNMLYHAARFAFWQFFFIPALTIAVVVVTMAVASLIS